MIRFLFLCLILMASCQKTNDCLPKVARVNIGVDPQTLDPRKARDLNAVTIVHMLFEGLTRTSKSGEIELALAKEVAISEDGLLYTFDLRKSNWSNGDPLTAKDFAESWKSILSPAFPSDMAYQLYPIKNARKAKMGEISLDQIGVRTLDAYTLIVELENPLPYFLELLSMPSFFPLHKKLLEEDRGWSQGVCSVIGNGPFYLKDWKHSDHLEVVKNTHYWQPKEVLLDGLDLCMVTGDTEIRLFEEGKLDWAGSPLSTIPIDAVAKLKETEQLQASPLSGTYFFRVNTSEKIKDRPNLLANALFRKALACAVDRKAITEHILQGGQTPATSLVPLEMGLADEGYFLDDDEKNARFFLELALEEQNRPLEDLDPITLSYYNNERNTVIAQAVQKQWEKNLGLKIELEAVEPKVFFQKISSKEFQLAAGSWTADFNDPINFLEIFKFKDASTNNTNWEDSKYVDLLNQSGLCGNQKERKVFLRKAEEILMDQMPFIPIFHFALNYLHSEKLKEVVLSPLGQIDFRWAHFTDEGEEHAL